MRLWAARLLWIAAMLVPVAACDYHPPEALGDARPVDMAPACPDGDTDGDGVCNAVDKCPDEDDRVDKDADGKPDACDDWPCAVQRPQSPGDPMSDGAPGRQWSAAFINIGDRGRVAARTGGEIRVRFAWGIRIDCPGGGGGNQCRGQAEYGFGASRIGCLYDNNVPDNQLIGTNADLRIPAPSEPGVYELRLNAGMNTECGTGTTWYGATPGANSTIGLLCIY